MADTTFVDGTTLTAEDWFNDVNRLHYTICGDPATLAALRTTVLPFADGTAHIAGSADATKKIRFEVDGITTGTTRVITAPDADVTLGLGAATGVGQTFLAADVALNNTANYFNICNTGAIGASGQVWKITASVALRDTAGAAGMRIRIWDGSATVYQETGETAPAANQDINVTVCALVTLSGVTTFHLSCKDVTSTSGSALTTANAGTANKATWILAERLT